MRIGAHVPMAGGLLSALEYAIDTGCESFQIFSKSPRRWVSPPLDPVVCAAFVEGREAAGIGPVFCHGSYLINPGAEDPALWERSIAGLADEFVRARQVEAAGVVLHLGRRFSDDEDESVDRAARAIIYAAELAGEEAPPILLENSAGAGRQFGVTIPELGLVLARLRAAGVRAGLCIDTCHGFAAGWDLRSEAGWRTLLDDADRFAGVGAIALVHANDCKGELGSHKDRHDWIGDGLLGETAFAQMLQEERLCGSAAVVEMPGDPPEKDQVNVMRLKALRAGGVACGDRDPERA